MPGLSERYSLTMRCAIEHLVPLLEQRDDVYLFGFEGPYPVPDAYVSLTKWQVLPLDDKFGVVAMDTIDRPGGRRHREDNLEDWGDVLIVEEMGRVIRAGYTLQRFEEDLGFRLFDRRVGDPERQEEVLAEPVLLEERVILRQELLDDVVIDLLSLAVPHLLIADKVRVGVIGLLDLVFPPSSALSAKKGVVTLSGCWVLMHRGILTIAYHCY